MGFAPFVGTDDLPDPTAMLEHLLGCACCYWNRQDVLADMIALRGGGTILAFHWNPDTLPPSWTLYQQGNEVFLDIAGTVNNEQIFNHLTGLFTRLYVGGLNFAHTFFFEEAIQLLNDLIAVLPANFQTMPFHITGHSYGGSVGYLVALDFRRSFPSMFVDFMGIAPSKTMTSGFAGLQPKPNIHWGHPIDPIPMLPLGLMTGWVLNEALQFQATLPINWRHYSTGFYLDDQGKLALAPQDNYNGLPLPWFISGGLEAHSMKGLRLRVDLLVQRTARNPDNLALLDALNVLVNTPDPQADTFPFAVRDYIDIPFCNANLFLEPLDGPLTPDNVLQVNNAQGQPGVPGPGSAILGGLSGGGSMPCKVTFFYTTNQGGFSESWIANVPYNSISMRQHIKPYWSARKAVTGRTTFLQYVRVADLTTPRLVTVFTATDIIRELSNQGDGISGPAIEAESDISSTALLIRRINAGRTSNLFLRGIPDGVVDTGGKYDPIGGFDQAMNRFIAAVINLEWGWFHRGVAVGFPDQLVDVTINQDGTLTFQSLNNVFFGLLAGKNYQLTISQCRSSANLNATWVARIGTAANLMKTTKKGALSSYKGPDGLITMYASPRTFVPILQGQVIRAVERRFGRPFALAVGRAKNRPRG